MSRFAKNAAESSRRRMIVRSLAVAVVSLLAMSSYAQVDPGVRIGASGAGQPFASGLTAGELAFFNNAGKPQFTQIEAVADGLGPRFNLDSCAGCHVYPDIGGSSPPTNNPQVLRAPIMAPGNTVPSFLSIDGPIREVRFIRAANLKTVPPLAPRADRKSVV